MRQFYLSRFLIYFCLQYYYFLQCIPLKLISNSIITEILLNDSVYYNFVTANYVVGRKCDFLW